MRAAMMERYSFGPSDRNAAEPLEHGHDGPSEVACTQGLHEFRRGEADEKVARTNLVGSCRGPPNSPVIGLEIPPNSLS